MDKTEKEIKDVIVALSESLEKDNELSNREASSEILNSLKEAPYDFTNPDIFNVMFMFPLEQLLELVTRNLHKEQSEIVKDKYKPQFIFLHYGFLKSNIEKLIEKKRGTSSCVADVSRTVLSMYLNYSLTGDIPETNLEEHYWLPRFGLNEDWMNFCDGLYQLYYGKTDNYFDAYATLLRADIRKYSHTKFILLAHFKDGSSGVVDEQYDNDFGEAPIAKDGYFDIPKKAFSEKKPYANSNSLGDILNRFYYKVPEEDIVRFEIKKEELML